MHLAEFKDDYRENTIATYSEWLRREGLLQDIRNLIFFHVGNSEAYISSVFSNSIVTVCSHLFVCADAYLDVETNEQDESGDSSVIPTHFPSHARRPKASQKGMCNDL